MTLGSVDSYNKKLKLSVFYACTLYSDSLAAMTATISSNYNIFKNKIENKIKQHNIENPKTTLSTLSSCQHPFSYLKPTKKWQLQKLIVAVRTPPITKQSGVYHTMRYPYEASIKSSFSTNERIRKFQSINVIDKCKHNTLIIDECTQCHIDKSLLLEQKEIVQ